MDSGTGLPVIVESGNTSVPRTTQYGKDRAENIKDLCDSYGLDYAVKPDGEVENVEVS